MVRGKKQLTRLGPALPQALGQENPPKDTTQGWGPHPCPCP